jgi:hypothetical protein
MSVRLTWTAAPNSGRRITGYRIFRGKASGEERFFTAVGNVLTYRDTETRPDTKYFYVVRAVNALGRGPASNEARVRTNPKPAS